MRSVTVIQAVTPTYYHTVPGASGRITLSPEREAVTRHLTRLGPEKFPEFVADVLRVSGYQMVDVTEGTGDEQQDVLAIAPSGRRCLAQCKHASDPTTRFSPSELHLVFAAAHRNHCSEVAFVTTGDLTAPAKR